MVQLRHLGGALSRVAPGAGARATLPGEICLVALGVTPDADTVSRVHEALDGLERAVLPWRVGDYPNFVEKPVDASRFFDAATWRRLREVKAETTQTTCFAATTASRRPSGPAPPAKRPEPPNRRAVAIDAAARRRRRSRRSRRSTSASTSASSLGVRIHTR
jgi:hypothetical protein